jgi:hypothetical protein
MISESDVKEYLSYVEESIDKMCDYVKAVCKHELTMRSLDALKNAGMIEPESYREKVQDYDQSRRMAHDSALGEMELMNRICEQTGMTAIFPNVETTHRTICGKFMAGVVSEFYLRGVKGDADEIKRVGEIFGDENGAANKIIGLIEDGIVGNRD